MVILLPTILSVRSVDLPSHLPLSFFKSSQNWRSGLTLVYQSKFIFLIVKSSFKYSHSEKCINNSLFPGLIEIKHLFWKTGEQLLSFMSHKKFFLYIFQLKQVFWIALTFKIYVCGDITVLVCSDVLIFN